MTPILDTARISDVNSVMFLNRIKKMEGFELGKETERCVSSFHELGTKKRVFVFCFSHSNLHFATQNITSGTNMNQVVSLVAPLPFLLLLLFSHHVL